MRRRLLAIIAYGALLIIGLGVTVFLYWLYSPPKEALSVSPSPIPVVTKVVKEDGTCAVLGFNRCAVLKLTRCKNVSASGRVVTTLVGTSVQLTLPVSNDSSERGCINDIQLPMPIPPQATPGIYYFNFRGTYKINPLKTIVQEFQTERFEVQ